MDYKIPKFYQVLDRVNRRAIVKRKISTNYLHSYPNNAVGREEWCSQVIKEIAGCIGDECDQELLIGFFSSIAAIHNHVSSVSLFPSGNVVVEKVYFWVIIAPQIEILIEKIGSAPHSSKQLRYLSETFRAAGPSLLGNPKVAAQVITQGLKSQIALLFNANRYTKIKEIFCPNFNAELARMIKPRSFPTEQTINRSLEILKHELDGKVRCPADVCAEAKKLLSVSKVIHAAGMVGLNSGEKISCSDFVFKAHLKIFNKFQRKTSPDPQEKYTKDDVLAIINTFKLLLGNIDPARYLSESAVVMGRTKATMNLVNYNNGQYHCYALLEQIKSDLAEGRKINRVTNIIMLLEAEGVNKEQARSFFDAMDNSRFMLSAVFSSAIFLIICSGDHGLKESVDRIICCIARNIQSGADPKLILDDVACNQVILLKDLIGLYNDRNNLGELGVELCSFVHAFKYKFDPNSQPQSMDRLGLIFYDNVDCYDFKVEVCYDTPFGVKNRTLSLSGEDVSLKLIQLYNSFVYEFSKTPESYICNPLSRISEHLNSALSMDLHFCGSGMDEKKLIRSINKSFGNGKKKSILRIGGVRPYDVLRDINFYLGVMSLDASDTVNPGIGKYLEQPRAIQQLILKTLDAKKFDHDFNGGAL